MDHSTEVTKHDGSVGAILIVSTLLFTLLTCFILLGIF